MDYIPRNSRLVISILALLVAGCESGMDASADNSEVAKNGSTISRLFLSPVCSSGSESDVASQTLRVIDTRRTEGRSEVCINPSLRIPMVEGVFRVYPIGHDENYISLRCEETDSATRALSTIPNAGELALVVDDEIISTYHYLDSGEVARACGRIPSSDLEAAMDLCEEVAVRLGHDKDECAQICDLNTSSDLLDVCLVANAKSPP